MNVELVLLQADSTFSIMNVESACSKSPCQVPI